MNMSLEQVISSYEKNAERYHKAFLHCKAHGGEFYQSEAESNRICAEHDRQLADWLRELQERRKQPEIIRCKDCQYFGIDCHELYCRMWQSYTAENGYCHLAKRSERRTDD